MFRSYIIYTYEYKTPERNGWFSHWAMQKKKRKKKRKKHTFLNALDINIFLTYSGIITITTTVGTEEH